MHQFVLILVFLVTCGMAAAAAEPKRLRLPTGGAFPGAFVPSCWVVCERRRLLIAGELGAARPQTKTCFEELSKVTFGSEGSGPCEAARSLLLGPVRASIFTFQHVAVLRGAPYEFPVAIAQQISPTARTDVV